MEQNSPPNPNSGGAIESKSPKFGGLGGKYVGSKGKGSVLSLNLCLQSNARTIYQFFSACFPQSSEHSYNTVNSLLRGR